MIDKQTVEAEDRYKLKWYFDICNENYSHERILGTQTEVSPSSFVGNCKLLRYELHLRVQLTL